MRTAILMFGLMAMCQVCTSISLCNHCCGVHSLHNQLVNSADPDETAPAGAVSSGSSLFTGYIVRDELSELVNQLKTSTYSRLRSGGSNYARNYYMTSPEMEPLEYDIDQLFEFPGSKFLIRLIEKNFSDPNPMSNYYMADFPVSSSPNVEWNLREMESKWTTLTHMFYGDWVELTDLFTRRVTEWVAYKRFACPSVYFDKIFSRWNFNKMTSLFESEDETMFDVFLKRLPTLLPTYPQERLDSIAREAAMGTHILITEEIMQHIIGYGMKDVAVFSHKFYWGLWKHYQNINSVGWQPDMMSPGFLGNYVNNALMGSNVRCHTGQEIMKRYSNIISSFKLRYEEYTVMAIRGSVINFLMEKMEGEPVTTSFNEVILDEITAEIRRYFDNILEEFVQYESYFATSDVTSLEQLFESIMGPTELPFIKRLFRQLGYYPENNGSGVDQIIGMGL